MNQLVVTPHFDPLEDGSGPAEFWTLSIDGRDFATHARPFDASTAEIVTAECRYCYRCSAPDVSVRRIGADIVAWFVSSAPDLHSHLPRNALFMFDRLAYERRFGASAEPLPVLNIAVDLPQLIASVDLPDWHSGLYTTPELPQDLSGQQTLCLLCEALHDASLAIGRHHDALPIQTLAVGLDVPGVPETRIELLATANTVFFRFVAHPELAIWFTVPGLAEKLARLGAGSTLRIGDGSDRPVTDSVSDENVAEC